ncbi:hypothetical protein EJB05_32752 [Eragrostis curvula]|uniref:TF-B3 domain-containing protein n=1 Tax=Eragrostis curvula TaxID=38414 RepID=A0A5J9UH07_9POAL|nr:hypothetical protein EJB05_32752 [Eragrostis curvula]
MAIDQSLKRKRGRPAGSKSKPAKSKMERKMDLVKERLAMLDSTDSSNSSRSESDNDEDDFVPMDDELAIVVHHQPLAIHYDAMDDEKKVIPKKVSDVRGQKISASFHGDCGSAMARAKELQAKLPQQHPSFVKEMLKSHVVQGFWLGLPAKFCNKHLPMYDTVIVLEDENGDNHDTNYLGAKQGLSGGWRGFAMKHVIKVGDAVVFELVGSAILPGSKKEPPKFKTYIVRANEFTTTDGAVSLLNLDVCREGNLSSSPDEENAFELKSEEDLKVNTNTVHGEVPLIDANGVVNEAIDGIRMLDSDIEFEDMTSFSKFNIIIDRLVIDCKFHEHLRRTYYDLCCSQKAFLHKHLLKQMNLTLVVGVIMETINIAEGIRACKTKGSSREDLLIWRKTLESFELLGMDVAFLLKRVNAILGLFQTPSRGLSKLRLESALAAEKVKALELELSGVKDVLRKMDAEMKDMEASVKKSDEALQQLATAPW